MKFCQKDNKILWRLLGNGHVWVSGDERLRVTLNSGFCSLLLELAEFGNCNYHNLVCLQFSVDYYNTN
jgi:hypothetical protein